MTSRSFGQQPSAGRAAAAAARYALSAGTRSRGGERWSHALNGIPALMRLLARRGRVATAPSPAGAALVAP